jgi:hypothetical protein
MKHYLMKYPVAISMMATLAVCLLVVGCKVPDRTEVYPITCYLKSEGVNGKVMMNVVGVLEPGYHEHTQRIWLPGYVNNRSMDLPKEWFCVPQQG